MVALRAMFQYEVSLAVARHGVIRVGSLRVRSVLIMVLKCIFLLFVIRLHGAKHFCEKFGDSWPEAGREQFNQM